MVHRIIRKVRKVATKGCATGRIARAQGIVEAKTRRSSVQMGVNTNLLKHIHEQRAALSKSRPHPDDPRIRALKDAAARTTTAIASAARTKTTMETRRATLDNLGKPRGASGKRGW